MKKIFILLSIIPHLTLFSQGTAGDKAQYEYRYLIDMPTAGILKKGFVGVVTDILPEGVLIARIEVGVFDNISFGISYGGSNVIGAGKPDWYELPGINIRFRIVDESVALPSITLGFDSQGKGEYFKKENRYAFKSPGFFGAVSKNFALLGFLSVHGSANYSFEGDDGDNFVNLMAGVEKTLGPNLSLIMDYDFTLNDNTTKIFGDGNGYLNVGLRWSLGEGFTIGFDLRDLLDNKRWNPSTADRALRIEYIKSIF
ncbi:MAG: hypothetical protein A2V93_04875 [Ignavibacteria bacterium RBG_16_34_14]|nr:MAG: hypothetical protein A2V93_04875 [Ignavibacteria bacterium RBG_16_34_14]